MPKILVNFEFNFNGKVKILNNEKCFPDMPIAIADYGRDYKEPVLIKSQTYSFPEIIDADEIITDEKEENVESIEKTEKSSKKEKGDEK